MTNLFLKNDLPVAEIYDFDGETGVIVMEDLGDTILRPILDKADEEEKENLINEAIRLIARIQTATESAFETNSIASKLKFDQEKLGWELEFFKTHYFETYKKQPLNRRRKSPVKRRICRTRPRTRNESGQFYVIVIFTRQI